MITERSFETAEEHEARMAHLRTLFSAHPSVIRSEELIYQRDRWVIEKTEELIAAITRLTQVLERQ